MMNETIQQKITEILSNIHPEKHEQDDIVFDQVERLVKLIGNEHIASKVYENAPKKIAKLAILFGILIWSTPDNGSELLRQTREWFFENDLQKLALVLTITEVYPYHPFDELEVRLLEIRADFPELKEKCNEWLEGIKPLIQREKEEKSESGKIQTTTESQEPLIEIPEPVNCHLWTAELSKSLVLEAFESVKNYTQDYHDSRDLKKCKSCGQLYFVEFHEMIDFTDGNNREYYSYIPVKNEADADKLNESSYFALAGFLSIRMNFPPPNSKPYWLHRKE